MVKCIKYINERASQKQEFRYSCLWQPSFITLHTRTVRVILAVVCMPSLWGNEHIKTIAIDVVSDGRDYDIYNLAVALVQSHHHTLR